MQITLETQPLQHSITEALVSCVFEETDPIQGRIAEIDQTAAVSAAQACQKRRIDRQNARVHFGPRACGTQGGAAAPRRSREARAI